MELVMGQLVRSRKGRDVARWYAVVGFGQAGGAEQVLCANGHKWTLEVPKGKNSLHLQPANTVLSAQDMQTDLQLKAALRAFEQSQAEPKRGG